MPETRESRSETDRSGFSDSRRLPDTEGLGASARSFRAHYCAMASFPRRPAARRIRAQGLLPSRIRQRMDRIV